MARVIPKSGARDVLEAVKWKEFVVIYVQSVILSFFIMCKNILVSFKRYFDGKFAPTRQNIVHKFPALSLIGSQVGSIEIDKQSSQQRSSIACPHQLMDSQLGQHKYIKLKVRKTV